MGRGSSGGARAAGVSASACDEIGVCGDSGGETGRRWVRRAEARRSWVELKLLLLLPIMARHHQDFVVEAQGSLMRVTRTLGHYGKQNGIVK